MKISKLSAQKRILIAWVIGTFVMVLIVIFQHSAHKFGSEADEIWDWFLPNVFPTLAMMLGAYVATSRQEKADAKKTDRFNYQLCMGGIAIYFLVMLVIFGLTNYSIENNTEQLTPLGHLRNYSKLITAIHGAVTLLLGIFFVQKDE